MEALVAKQTVVETEIDRLIRNYKKANKVQKSSAGYIKKRMESLELEWNKYKENHAEISELYDEGAHKALTYFVNDTFSVVEERVFEMLGIMIDRLDEIQSKSSSVVQGIESNHQAVSDLQLPRINLPRFMGDYKSWPSFHDLFISLIDKNKTLTPVQKLHHLKGSLGGDAEQLIKHLQITDANYESAWKLLVKRFENKRVLLNAHLKTLFSLQHHTSESASALKTLMDTTRECLEAVKGLGIDVDSWDPLIVYNLVQKLSIDTLSQWELNLSKRTDPAEIPSLDEFLSFIEIRFRTLEAVSLARSKQPMKEKHLLAIHTKKQPNSNENLTSVARPANCQLCKQDHLLRQCSKFIDVGLNDRRALVHKFSLCYNCLNAGHSVTKCRSKHSCRICRGRHHTLLHQEISPQAIAQAGTSKSIEDSSVDKVRVVHAATKQHHQGNTQVLLATEVRIKGVNGSELAISNKIVRFIIRSRYKPEFTLSIEALVLPKLTDIVPSQKPNHQEWTHLENLFLADPIYFKPAKIDILLGASVYAHVLEEGIRKGTDATPMAQLTSFGWIVSGGYKPTTFTLDKDPMKSLHCSLTSDVDTMLRRFWEIEEGPIQVHLTDGERMCEEIYENSVRRKTDGRYIVKLPLNTPNIMPDLGDSRELAKRLLLQIEGRIEQNPDIQRQYHDFMKDYLEQGHMELVIEENSNVKPNYLPHHFVIKESSSTTKLRVVFDASRKTTNKKSLNDCLLVGPTLQEDLFSILTRWRRHRIAFSADIKQMYRQILVDQNDADYQRILWRFHKGEPISEYRLLTVTYGTSCAPYLATRTLQQLARDEAKEFPIASKSVLNDFYVDDVLSGGDTVTEVLELQTELKSLLNQGKFELRKWVTNSQEVLLNVSEEERELDLPFDITKDVNIKALGIYWDPAKDIFTFRLNSSEYKPPTTKRSLLSNVAKIFDPLGWLSPVIIIAKILLQNLWIQRLEWDSKLPPHLEEQWKNYCQNLNKIEQIKIPRWINYSKTSRAVQLHVYSDASMHAYAACVYARIVAEDNSIYTSLLTAKTRVAPIKLVTVPRLELCGALLGSKLVKHVAGALSIPETHIYSWTDSKIVLAWIKSHPRQWKQFVANRVAEIQETLHSNRWNYVPSKDNPADCASRGLSASDLRQHDLWWLGPSWLRQDNDKWPQEKCEADVTEAIELSLTHRYSSWSKLVRIIAYCRRFYNNIRSNHKVLKSGHLKVKEIQEAEKCVLKLTQKECFYEEINCLRNNRPINRSSKLLNLNPFIDNEGLLRVGGRLQNSHLSYEEIHPIILPGNNHLTKLVVEEMHKTTLHGGAQLMLNLLRKTYWITNARNLTKRIIHNCITCFRYNAQTRNQLMGSLPDPRVKPSRAFLHTGVDFAGPINIKEHAGRGRIRTTKGYVSLFICLATRAVHLEAVSDLSTNAFLAAFRRFTGRRGLCSDVYSDCGTNFVGANRRLSEEYYAAIKSISPQIISALALKKVNWHFIPPASPHFGGLWEAGVKSMKYHLRRIMQNMKLTYEEFSTVLVQIEACLNSRPLCALTDDPTDYTALTPGHFLIGNALLTPLQEDLPNTKISHITRWKLLQQAHQDFWKRWSSEYLSRLQQRPKWLKRQPNLNIGDLVLLKDENLPPSQWILARIEATHPGLDGLVRVVTLKYKNTSFKRPITKICPLPTGEGSPVGSQNGTNSQQNENNSDMHIVENPLK